MNILTSGQLEHILIVHQLMVGGYALIGAMCVYLGYRLIHLATVTQGQMMIKQNGKFEVSVKNLSPGIWFAIFGAVIVGVCAWKSVNFDFSAPTPATIHSPPVPAKPGSTISQPGGEHFSTL